MAELCWIISPQIVLIFIVLMIVHYFGYQIPSARKKSLMWLSKSIINLMFIGVLDHSPMTDV